ncbi:MAG TPA: asparagine synthase (glutamine-hydrolyzing), partial [Bacteroidia bacterium]|nr:asparagine synthase (glutamine-hydrolyzing) [Bacteroidia bacterium]
LNGMFAFAIYDKQEEELHLYRDRLGIKPLYYYWDEQHFAFASEIGVFKQLGKLKLEINPAAILQYLNLGYIPAPFSIYKNIYKLDAGGSLTISKKGIQKNRYWSLPQVLKKNPEAKEQQVISSVSDMLSESVRYQLRSDVPFGIFLSGGTDSSLIAAKAVELTGAGVNTFSIGFESRKYDESIHARSIAGFFKTNHHEFHVKMQDGIDMLETYMDIYGEPFADSSGIPTLFVSQLARKNVTVALSGEGGDELFHGYGSYKWATRLDNFLIYQNRHLIAATLSNMPGKYKRLAGKFRLAGKKNIHSHIHTQEQYYFSHEEAERMFLTTTLDPSAVRQNSEFTDIQFLAEMSEADSGRTLSAAEKQALYDIRFYLPDDLLTKIDRASMHFSLETRVPFLDHRLVELAVNIDPALKSKGRSKHILKEILYRHIPATYFNRPKQGFSIPIRLWLKTGMRFLIDDFLNETVIRNANLVNYDEVRLLVKRFDAGEDFLFHKLWLLICLHKWFLKETSSHSVREKFKSM